MGMYGRKKKKEVIDPAITLRNVTLHTYIGDCTKCGLMMGKKETTCPRCGNTAKKVKKNDK